MKKMSREENRKKVRDLLLHHLPIKVGFVGVGKLGKDAAEVLSEFYDVTGYDINPVDTTINMSDTLEGCVKNKDIVLIAVPTQHHIDYDGRYATSHLEPKDFDYTIAISVTKQVDQLVDKDTLIVMISTMLPGTVRREIAPLINNGRFIYNPYLIAQGTVKFDMRNPEMIMIGTEDGSKTGDAKMLSDFYQPMLQNSPRVEIGTWEEMESTKVFYNTFITAKLCLVNMIQDAAMAVGHMNVDVVTDALKYSTDRIMGPKYMTAGLGDGGGCHPRDNIALRSFAEKHNFGYDLFDAIMKAREEQANNIAKHFEKVGVSKDMPCVILGAGFKPGLATQHEGSPSILVGFYLEKLGYTVTYDEVLDQPAAYMLGWPKYFDNHMFAPGSYVIDPWRSCKDGGKNVTVYHYGDTRNHPLGLVDLYNGRVYEDEEIN
jgi:UDPglucose 6-dehydrogenase